MTNVTEMRSGNLPFMNLVEFIWGSHFGEIGILFVTMLNENWNEVQADHTWPVWVLHCPCRDGNCCYLQVVSLVIGTAQNSQASVASFNYFSLHKNLGFQTTLVQFNNLCNVNLYFETIGSLCRNELVPYQPYLATSPLWQPNKPNI